MNLQFIKFHFRTVAEWHRREQWTRVVWRQHMVIEPGLPQAVETTLTLAAAFQQLAESRLGSVVQVFCEEMALKHVDFALVYQSAFTFMSATIPQ